MAQRNEHEERAFYEDLQENDEHMTVLREGEAAELDQRRRAQQDRPDPRTDRDPSGHRRR